MIKHTRTGYNFPYSLYTNGYAISDETCDVQNTKQPAMKDGPRYGTNINLETVHDEEGDIRLRVYRGALNIKHSKLIDCKIIVTDLEHADSYALLAAYDELAKVYYVAYDQIEYHAKHGHFLNISFYFCNQGTQNMESCYDGFQPFSELSLLGYKTGKKGLSDEIRHKIIRHVLEKRIMKCHQVVTFIQTLIALREGQCKKDFSKSIRDWKNDLQFVYEKCVDLIEEEHKLEVLSQQYGPRTIHKITGISEQDYFNIYIAEYCLTNNKRAGE